MRNPITPQDLFENKEWREDQNIAAGRDLTVKEMWQLAVDAAEHLNESYIDDEKDD